MQTEAMITTLKTLKLNGMARAIAELAEQSSAADRQAEGILDILLKAELAEREVRSVNYQMKSAKFPVYRDLAGFDFTQAQVDEALMRELHRCTVLDDPQNIVLVGGPGKTHLATALGVQAIRHRHRRVRILSALELANALEQEKRDARQSCAAGTRSTGSSEAIARSPHRLRAAGRPHGALQMGQHDARQHQERDHRNLPQGSAPIMPNATSPASPGDTTGATSSTP